VFLAYKLLHEIIANTYKNDYLSCIFSLAAK